MSLEKKALVEYANKHDNLLLTPHLGGATIESMEKTEIFMAKKFVKWVEESMLL
jgi:D-3-phosphoglycerate dehydrogenase